jgi:hypothetical protein
MPAGAGGARTRPMLCAVPTLSCCPAQRGDPDGQAQPVRRAVSVPDPYRYYPTTLDCDQRDL